MRMVIEVDDSERDAIKKFCVAKNTSYSAVFRALFRLALTEKIKDEDLRSALGEGRSVLQVTLTGLTDLTGGGAKIDLDAPLTREERIAISGYLRRHPTARVDHRKWRQGYYKE